MPYVVYLDETGDHGMAAINTSFPVFGVAFLVCDIADYCSAIVPEFYRLKLDFWGHEGVILHSRDIRRQQGDFSFLVDPGKRSAFYARVNQIMGTMPYQVIMAIIHKERHQQAYGRWAENPYDLALMFALERLLPLLEGVGQSAVQVIAEARGTNEDNELRLSFLNIINNGTSFIRPDRFKKIQFNLTFLVKARNIIGTQMADLVAYPVARHVIDPTAANPAYAIVEPKFYAGPGRVCGLKVFP